MEKTMTIKELMEKVAAKKRGRLGTIEYYSIKTATNGEEIYKVTKCQFHKVNYRNTKEYVEPKTKRADNFTYLLEDCIKEHNETHNVLLAIIPFKSKCHKTRYFNSKWEEISKAEAESRIVEKKSNAPLSYYTVKANQVFSYT